MRARRAGGRLATLATVSLFGALISYGPAFAAGECRGVFVRTSQGVRMTPQRKITERREAVRAGAQAIFVGETAVRGLPHYMVGGSSLFPASDIQLRQPGCELMALDPL